VIDAVDSVYGIRLGSGARRCNFTFEPGNPTIGREIASGIASSLQMCRAQSITGEASGHSASTALDTIWQ